MSRTSFTSKLPAINSNMMPVGFFKHLICLYDWWIECELLSLVDMSGTEATAPLCVLEKVSNVTGLVVAVSCFSRDILQAAHNSAKTNNGGM